MAEIDVFPLAQGPRSGLGSIGGWIVTSYFGGRRDPLTGGIGNHGGMDLAFIGCRGQRMYAVKSGLLSQGWDESGGGKWSNLYADDGDYFGYGHALDFRDWGDRKITRWVDEGEWIATVNSTGGSTGDHLHFAYRPKGASGYRDPYDILVNAANAGRMPGQDRLPDTPSTPRPPTTIPEVADMGCVFSIPGKGQFVIDGGVAQVIRSDAHRHLLLRTLNATKHPLANGDEWIDITDPGEVEAFNTIYWPKVRP